MRFAHGRQAYSPMVNAAALSAQGLAHPQGASDHAMLALAAMAKAVGFARTGSASEQGYAQIAPYEGGG